MRPSGRTPKRSSLQPRVATCPATARGRSSASRCSGAGARGVASHKSGLMMPLIRLGPERSAMISGVHAIVFSPAAEEVRAFFRDTLGLPFVDAGDGWLIFALPPAELAVHPADAPNHEIYLMCDDLEATLASLERKGVEVRRPVREEAWGFVTEIVLPGGTELA